MDSLDESGLAVSGMLMSHGSSELSATLDTGKFKTSRGTVLKYELSSNKCWRESGVVGPFDAGRNGRCEECSSMILV
jgi:hypothetical protein